MAIHKPAEGSYKDRRYFSSIKNYTLALLNAFNGINFYNETEDENTQKAYTIPISFGNYEKSIALQDFSESDLNKMNFNFLPRMVLSFEGLQKAPDRQTQKYNTFKKLISGDYPKLDIAYNSVAYDFNYTLLIQARGMTIASQIIEQILVKFNPSLNLNIKEYPLLSNLTQTQILIEDPNFEILDEFSEEDINIINISIPITIRGNLYSPLDIKGPIEVVKMFTHVWDQEEYKLSKLSAYYNFDVNPRIQNEPNVVSETIRTFNGTQGVKFNGINYNDIEEDEEHVIETREDYIPPETVTYLKPNPKKDKE